MCIRDRARAAGGCLPLFKVLMTNVCEKNCRYCGIRASHDVPRASFTPDELAAAFDRLHRADLVDGLFLSSGVSTGPALAAGALGACSNACTPSTGSMPSM